MSLPTPSEAARTEREDRTGESAPLALQCGACGHEWSAPTRWGEIVEPEDERCECCGARGESR